MVIQALRHIGQRNVDDEIVTRLQKQLSDDDRMQLLPDIRYAPAWITAILRRVAGPDGTILRIGRNPQLIRLPSSSLTAESPSVSTNSFQKAELIHTWINSHGKNS